MKIIKTIIGLFKKLDSLKEIFLFISVLGEILDFAVDRLKKLESEIE